jgi:hypothetical protein
VEKIIARFREQIEKHGVREVEEFIRYKRDALNREEWAFEKAKQSFLREAVERTDMFGQDADAGLIQFAKES